MKKRRRITGKPKRRSAPTAARRRGSATAGLNKKVALLTRDRDKLREQKKATSEVLRVISSSPTNIQPVLDAVGENAARLCDANNAVIFRLEGDVLASLLRAPCVLERSDGRLRRASKQKDM